MYTLSCAFILGTHKVDNTLVYLDARVDSAFLEQLGERSAAAGFLVQSLVEKNNTGDVLVQSGISSEQQLKVKRFYSLENPTIQETDVI